jgi:hypothetical protein
MSIDTRPSANHDFESSKDNETKERPRWLFPAVGAAGVAAVIGGVLAFGPRANGERPAPQPTGTLAPANPGEQTPSASETLNGADHEELLNKLRVHADKEGNSHEERTVQAKAAFESLMAGLNDALATDDEELFTAYKEALSVSDTVNNLLDKEFYSARQLGRTDEYADQEVRAQLTYSIDPGGVTADTTGQKANIAAHVGIKGATKDGESVPQLDIAEFRQSLDISVENGTWVFTDLRRVNE